MNDAEQNIRAVHVVDWLDERIPGPSHIILRLCRELALVDNQVRIITFSSQSTQPADTLIENHAQCGGLSRFLAPLKSLDSLKKAVGHTDIIHNHGLWRMANIYPSWVTLGKACRLVVSPHGSLAPSALQYSAVAKNLFWLLLQGPALRHATCFHATAEGEYEDIRSAGLRSQPVCIIPLGIDIPPIAAKPATKMRRILFLGRLHPIKGLATLLQAWSAVYARHGDWELRIAGPSENGYLREMQALARELKLERVDFCGPVFGEAKYEAYREAEVFVLPSHSENFGLVVTEALAAGTPVIATKGTPWARLVEEGAGWWIEKGVDSLVACLEAALEESQSALAERGARGREWMRREYSWARVGFMMSRTYRWLVHGGETPAWVRPD